VARCIHGSSASLSYRYRPDGPLDEMQYPDGEKVAYHYDTAGQLDRIGNWLTIEQRSPDGWPTRMRLGNGVTRRLQYDLPRQWLRSQTDSLGVSPVFDVSYGYLPNGRARSSQSTSNAWSLNVTTDTVGRLRSSSGSQTQTWAYDAAGNMVFNSLVGLYAYPAPGPAARQPHAAQSAGTTQLRYDDNGLLSMATNAAGQTRSIDWNFDHLPAVVADFDGTRTDYEFDAFGNLAVEAKANETVLYFGDFLRRSSLSGATQLMLLDGKPFAEKSATGQRRWYHLDRGDALRAVSNEQGQVVARSNYGPYGAPVNLSSSNAPVPQRHAGAVLLGASSLQLLGARLYDPLLGRFLGPDSIVPDLHHPQAANRYAYGYSAPLDFVDPSGHQPEGIGIGTTVGSGGWGGGFDAGFHHFSALPTSAMVASNSPTFLPPPVQQSAGTSISTHFKPAANTSPNTPGIFRIDWNDPAQLQKYVALREYARTNTLCGHCHAYTPDMSLQLLTGEALRDQKLMVAGAGAGAVSAFAFPLLAEIAGSEALLSGSIWLYTRATMAWNVLLTLGYGTAGISLSPTPRLTPGDSRTMVRELGQAIGSVPVPSREQAVRGMLQQIAQANEGWAFTEQAHLGGTVFIGSSRLPTPSIWVAPSGQVLYGTGSFTVGEGAFQFIWTSTPRVLAP
jgi:RHS repeat-associated protein